METNKRFVNDLRQALVDDDSKDVVFKIGSTQVKAHKFMLVTRSPVFKRMFSSDMIESRTNEIEITDISIECFNAFLEFIYTGECEQLELLVKELLFVAVKYEVLDLIAAAGDKLVWTMNSSNAIENLILFDRYQMEDYKSEVIDYIEENKGEVFTLETRQFFEAEHMELAVELYAKSYFE